MRRIIKKLIIVGIICIVAIGLIYIFTNKPAILKSTDLSLVGVDDEMSKEYEQDVIDRINAGSMPAYSVYDADKLPEEWKDGKFVTVAVDMTMRNITLFSIKNIVAEISNPEEKSKIIWSGSDVEPQNIKPFSKEQVTVMWMDMYYGDMDYDEIEKYICSQYVNISYNIPFFGKRQMKASLKNAKLVEVITKDDDGNTINLLDE